MDKKANEEKRNDQKSREEDKKNHQEIQYKGSDIKDMIDLRELIREVEQDDEEEQKKIADRRKARKLVRQKEEEKRRKRNRKIRTVAISAVIVFFGAVVVFALLHISCGNSSGGNVSDETGLGKVRTASTSNETASTSENTSEPEAAAATAVSSGSDQGTTTASDVRLCAVGDNLISERMIEQAANAAQGSDGSSYDFSYLYQDVQDYISEHELAWIDVETDINNEIEPAGYPQFSTPGQDGIDLYNAGFDIFSLCNNHTYDLGVQGLTASENFWTSEMPSGSRFITTGLWKKTDDSSIAFTQNYESAGDEAQFEVQYDDIPVYTCSNGKKVAFLTYTQMTNALDSGSLYHTPDGADSRVIYLYETDLIRAQIQKADEIADAVVVACHWGDEDSHEVTDFQKEKAQELADDGADLIIGDHPHVVQNAETLTASDGRKVFCAYSLGNFVSTQEQPDELIGVILDCTLHFRDTDGNSSDPEVTVESPKLVPVMTDYGQDGTKVHAVLLKNYTDEEARAHGISGYITDGTEFSMEYIQNVLQNNIDAQYLALGE
ncbi:MAG: CapA family protein [Eubacterium sp.]|nr:CapA family protein [Eubacterium sp.]